MKSEPILYEDAAQEVTVTGWCCNKCRRYWAADEHMARYCCSTDLPCECGGRRTKSRAYCEKCCSERDAQRWKAKYENHAKPWDGNFPLSMHRNDKYFFDEDALFEYLDELLWDDIGDAEFRADDPEHVKLITEAIEASQFITCSPNKGRHFVLSEFLEDDLPGEDYGDAERLDSDASEVVDALNKFIADNAPFSWNADGYPVTTESIVESFLDWKAAK